MPVATAARRTPKASRRGSHATPAADMTVLNASAASSDEVNREDIARLAFSFWEDRNCQDGSPEEDWYRAEQQIRAGKLTVDR